MLEMKDVHQMLAGHEFLSGMDQDDITKLAEITRLKVVPAGQYLFRIGDAADCCYLIREGLIALELYHTTRGPVTLQTVGSGKVIGWSWMLTPYKWQFDGHALELTRGFCIGGGQLRELCESDHEFGYQMYRRFMPVIAERLEATRLQLMDVFAPPQ